MPDTHLYAPARLGSIAITNRFVITPTLPWGITGTTLEHPLSVTDYAKRANAGLIISEPADISPQGRGFLFHKGLYLDEHVKQWRLVTDAVHHEGGRIAVQLAHAGRLSHTSLSRFGEAPVSASSLQAGGLMRLQHGFERPSMPRTLSNVEVDYIVEDYRHAALQAIRARFDAVEICMAHGFLLDQFIRDSTNLRTDHFGGNIDNRLRLPLQVVRAVIDLWGPDRIGVRLTPTRTTFGDTPLDSHPQATYMRLVERLSHLKIAYIHVHEQRIPVGPERTPMNFRELRSQFSGAYIAGGRRDLVEAAQSVKHGQLTGISVASLHRRGRQFSTEHEPSTIGPQGYIGSEPMPAQPNACSRQSA